MRVELPRICHSERRIDPVRVTTYISHVSVGCASANGNGHRASVPCTIVGQMLTVGLIDAGPVNISRNFACSYYTRQKVRGNNSSYRILIARSPRLSSIASTRTLSRRLHFPTVLTARAGVIYSTLLNNGLHMVISQSGLPSQLRVTQEGSLRGSGI